MNLWQSLNGQVVAELTSADVTGAMAVITKQGISIHRAMFVDELTVQLTLNRADWKAVKAIAGKRGEQFTVRGRRGVFWPLFYARKRPVLLFGIVFVLFLMFSLPTKILFIRVEGNAAVPARQILAEAESCGIRFGANRRQIRSEQIKNELLRAIPELQWAGVNTSGCVATISVREGKTEKQIQREETVSSIVARRDGVILTCTVTAGSGQCVPGQAVREGQVLISGYTDCGLLIKTTQAEGEIQAETHRTISIKSMVQRRIRGQMKETSRQYSLILGKKRINFANSSRICDASCGRMYEEYYITLPGGFTLPVALAVQTHICGETVRTDSASEDLQQSMYWFARNYLTSQMISGSIVEENCVFSEEDEVVILDAEYICREMIGQRRQEGIGDTNGENS